MAELRKYGVATTILFPLIKRGAVDFETGAAFAAGDTKILRDEGTFVNASSNPVHEGNGIYSLALTASELQAGRILVTIIDQTSPKAWEDQAVIIDTYGNASAQHGFNLDLAQQEVTVADMKNNTLAAAAIATDALEAIADKVLSRPISSVEPGAVFRTLYGALASLVNRVRINSSGNLEIYQTDDATVLETLTATTDASQQPVTELDPT